jgi:hypothetical protein
VVFRILPGHVFSFNGVVNTEIANSSLTIDSSLGSMVSGTNLLMTIAWLSMKSVGLSLALAAGFSLVVLAAGR